MAIKPSGPLKRSELNGLPAFGKYIEEQTAVTEKTIQHRKTDCKIRTVVLAVLATFAVVGAGASIASSGGPAANMDSMLSFYSGIGLGAVSIGFLVWIAIEIVRTNSKVNSEKVKRDILLNELIPFGSILEAMRQEEAKREEIQAVVNKMHREDFDAFVKLATETILPQDRTDRLGDHDKNILCSISQHQEFSRIVDGNLILENILDQDAQDVIGKMTQERYKLHAQVAIGNPDKYPNIFAVIIQDDRLLNFDPKTIGMAFLKMTEHQQPLFISKLNEEQYQSLATEVLQCDRLGELNSNYKQALKALADSSYTWTLDADKQLTLINLVDEETANSIVTRLDLFKYKALIKEIDKISFSINVKESPAIRKVLTAIAHPVNLSLLLHDVDLSLEFFNQTVSLMDDNKKSEFLKYVSNRYEFIKDQAESSDECKKILEFVEKFIEKNLNLGVSKLSPQEQKGVSEDRKALFMQMARWPDLFAKYIGERIETFNAFWNAIDQDKKEAIMRSILANGNAKKSYTAMVNQELKQAFRKNERDDRMSFIPKSCIVDSLKQLSPRDFRKQVVDNKEICDDKNKRYTFALDVLESLGNDGTMFVTSLDPFNTWGKPRYHTMKDLLSEEAKRGDPISQSRWELMARFGIKMP
ncbi:MAG: hypothetical protein JJU12_04395 [Chlamydiales bacterium]|nr:hypothetical protein [Chlamydiales bacterium]